MPEYLSPHFTMEELVRTSHSSLQNGNSLQAHKQPYLDNLKHLAETVLEPLRVSYGKPIYVNSGFRSKTLNKAIGGATTSQHLDGQAADITTRSDALNKKLFYMACSMMDNHLIQFGQIILETPDGRSSWVHISTPNAQRGIYGQVMTYDGHKYKLLRRITTH